MAGNDFSGFEDLFGSRQRKEEAAPEQVKAESKEEQDKKDKKRKETYAAYVNSVNQYNERKEKVLSLRKRQEELEEEIQAFKRERNKQEKDMGDTLGRQREIKDAKKRELDAPISELNKKKDRLSNEKKLLDTELNLQRQGSSMAQIQLPVPEVSEEVKAGITNIFAKGWAAKEQKSYVDQPAEEMCGPGKTFKDIDTVGGVERAFAASDLCKELMNPVPGDMAVKEFGFLISMILAGIFVLLAIFGGVNVPIVKEIISFVCYAIVWLAAGLLAAVVIFYFVKSFLPDWLSLIIGGIVGLFVVGSMVASFAASALVAAISGGIILRLFVAIIVGFILYIVVSLICSLKFVKALLKKLSFMKGYAIRALLKEKKDDLVVKSGLYCFYRHDEICSYFVNEHRASTISTLQKAIETKSGEILRLTEAIRSKEAEKEKVLEREDASMANAKQTWNGKLKRIDDDIQRKEDEIRRSKAEEARTLDELKKCVPAILAWQVLPPAEGKPLLSWKNEKDSFCLADGLCFEGTSEKGVLVSPKDDGISARKIGKNGFALYFDGRDHREDVVQAALKALQAFTRMNPGELMDLALIDLSDGSGHLRNEHRIDVLREDDKSSGGVGNTKKGAVRVVTERSELNAYVEFLKESERERVVYTNSIREELAQTIGNRRATLNDLNVLRRQKANAKPLRWQVILMVYSGMVRHSFDTDVFLKQLGNGLGDGYIPVFLVDRNEKITGLRQENELKWDALLKNARENRVDYASLSV